MKVTARKSSRTTPPLLLRLKTLSPKTEVIILLGIFFFFAYAVFALKLFPFHDGFHTFLMFFHYAISSLLNGTIPLWDPMAACGWPFFLSFLTSGILEPLFAVSVLIGKIFSLNVFQIYMTWVVLRTLPFLFGMFWLTKQLTRHSAIALSTSVFIYLTMAVSLLRDGVIFAIYWPLLLACLVYFSRSLKGPQPSLLSFYGAIVLFAVSMLSGMFSYTLAFLSIFGICAAAVYARKLRSFFKSLFLKIKLKHWVFGLVALCLLLSPAIVITLNYVNNAEHFAYVRVHHSHQGLEQRSISHFAKDQLDYMEVALQNSPRRMEREFGGVLFPFFYTMRWIADGTVYFGFLGVLGVIAGIMFWRSQPFLVFSLSALLSAFFMTWSSNEAVLFLRSVWPFLKILNQRQLLFPAFIIFAGVAGAYGARLFLSYFMLRWITRRATLLKSLITGVVILILGAAFVFVASNDKGNQPLWAPVAIRLYILFVVLLVAFVLLARRAAQNSKFIPVYLSFLLFIYLADANFYFPYLLRDGYRNTGVLAHSRMLRDKVDLTYVPYRTPVLPMFWGGPVVSVVHQLNLRSAFPLYWDCDALFSSKRYYDVISFLEPEKLKSLLNIKTPIVKLYSKYKLLQNSDDAILFLKEMDAATLNDTLVLQKRDEDSGIPRESLEVLSRRAFTGVAQSHYFLKGAERNMESSYLALFDRLITIPKSSFEEAFRGKYHARMLRVRFPEKISLSFASSADLLSRYFFPELPMAIDGDGDVYYISEDKKTMMKFVPGLGFLIEFKGDAPTLPERLFLLDERPPQPPEARVVEFGPNHIAIEAEGASEAALSYSDLYDANWRAIVDGKPAEILIANHAFKAVLVPPGTHRVVFRYEVRYLIEAIVVYFIGIICFFLFAIIISPANKDVIT